MVVAAHHESGFEGRELVAVVGEHSFTSLEHGLGQPHLFLEKSPLLHAETGDGLSEWLSVGTKTTKRN